MMMDENIKDENQKNKREKFIKNVYGFGFVYTREFENKINN